MNLHDFIFGVYPYLAGTIFLLGSWIRFDRDPYSWKTDSSQLLSNKNMRLANNLFHVGIIAIFLGHFVGLLTPHSVFQFLGVSDLVHQYIAIIAGIVFGIICLIGGIMLWMRRLTNSRIRATGRKMDIFILSWILVTLILGLATIPTSLGHAMNGDASVMIHLTLWVQSMVLFHADPSLLAGVDLIFKIHLFFAMSIFLFFPFTRLVHIWSAPIPYLFRAYQIVRRKKAPESQPNGLF